MATTQLMIQILVEETLFVPVTSIMGLSAWSTMNLNPARTTVIREIAVEDIGGVLGLSMPGAVNLGMASGALAFVDMVGAKSEAFLMAPSCVPSPPFAGMDRIGLSVNAASFTAPPGGKLLVQSLGIGAHTYVDQIS